MIELYDRYALDAKNVRRTNDGYLVTASRVARTGIQIYNGKEVGRPDIDKVRVFRPESEVFKKDTLHSLAHRPITLNHPREQITADNWRDHVVGQTGDEIVRDGQFIRVPLALMDSGAIKRVEDGERELSVGYVCDLVWEDGFAPNGERYDAVQRNIKANHIAIVNAARGGHDLRIGDDEQHGGPIMKTMLIDGITVEMTDTAIQVVTRCLDTLNAKVKDTGDQLQAALGKEEGFKTESASLKTQIATKDAEIVTLKKQLEDGSMTPQKLDALVKSRAVVIEKAQSILKDKLVVDGKTEHEIRKQVVDAIVGDAAKAWGEAEVSASFGTITARQQTDDKGSDVSLLANGFSGDRMVMGDAREKAYTQYETNLTSRWKNQN